MMGVNISMGWDCEMVPNSQVTGLEEDGEWEMGTVSTYIFLVEDDLLNWLDRSDLVFLLGGA